MAPLQSSVIDHVPLLPPVIILMLHHHGIETWPWPRFLFSPGAPNLASFFPIHTGDLGELLYCTVIKLQTRHAPTIQNPATIRSADILHP